MIRNLFKKFAKKSSREDALEFRLKFDTFMAFQMKNFQSAFGVGDKCIYKDNERSWLISYVLADAFVSSFVRHSKFELNAQDLERVIGTLKSTALKQLTFLFPKMQNAFPGDSTGETIDFHALKLIVDRECGLDKVFSKLLTNSRDKMLQEIDDPIRLYLEEKALALEHLLPTYGVTVMFFSNLNVSK